MGRYGGLRMRKACPEHLDELETGISTGSIQASIERVEWARIEGKGRGVLE